MHGRRVKEPGTSTHIKRSSFDDAPMFKDYLQDPSRGRLLLIQVASAETLNLLTGRQVLHNTGLSSRDFSGSCSSK